ncbi:MAG: hydrogenase maturation nickel metallochaperone HypA [Candidatus Zixiibacteriota bacterium]|nr:MAG: hydrogenase maturation nickel metallochaperone HypA [candidate division Zixibacteria bacterium]
MHELQIANEIIDVVEREMSDRRLTRIEAIGISLGALSGVDPEALRFGFEAATADTHLAGVRLELEELPVRAVCRGCERRIEIETLVFICPYCGSGDLDVLQGQELDIVYLHAE